MELRHLRYFVGVAQAGSYRKAAESLHVSQPALSRQIADLEDEVGTLLLVRHSQGVRLTPSGAGFLEDAQLVLARLDGAVQKARSRGHPAGPTLSLGMIGFFCSGFLDAALATLQRERPEVDVRLFEMPPEEQIVALESESIDLGITAAEAKNLHAGPTRASCTGRPSRPHWVSPTRSPGSPGFPLRASAENRSLRIETRNTRTAIRA